MPLSIEKLDTFKCFSEESLCREKDAELRICDLIMAYKEWMKWHPSLKVFLRKQELIDSMTSIYGLSLDGKVFTGVRLLEEDESPPPIESTAKPSAPSGGAGSTPSIIDAMTTHIPTDTSIQNRITKREGYVYCFSNPSMPGIVKIGMTERTPDARLSEANSSDTWRPPTPYKIEFSKKVSNPSQKEKILHDLLAKYTDRINPRKEFFRVSLEEVKKFFDLMDGDTWSAE